MYEYANPLLIVQVNVENTFISVNQAGVLIQPNKFAFIQLGCEIKKTIDELAGHKAITVIQL